MKKHIRSISMILAFLVGGLFHSQLAPLGMVTVESDNFVPMVIAEIDNQLTKVLTGLVYFLKVYHNCYKNLIRLLNLLRNDYIS